MAYNLDPEEYKRLAAEKQAWLTKMSVHNDIWDQCWAIHFAWGYQEADRRLNQYLAGISDDRSFKPCLSSRPRN
jgi:hypothetical protein